MEEVEVVVAHRERATLRVGDVFVKVDADPDRSAREVEAMRLAPVPTAPVLWHTPPVLALGRLPADLVERNLEVARPALRPHDPVFAHGDLQTMHVFVDGDTVTGVLDWSEAGPGDGAYDLAVLTLGHEDRLADVVSGYGGEVDVDVVTGWWSARSLLAARWLLEHGFDPDSPGCEFDVLRARM